MSENLSHEIGSQKPFYYLLLQDTMLPNTSPVNGIIEINYLKLFPSSQFGINFLSFLFSIRF